MSTIFCACENAYQDEKYGRHRRMWTPVGKGSKTQRIEKVRCTACGTEHPAPPELSAKQKEGVKS